MKYYLSDNLASDSDNKTQPSRACREAAANRNKGRKMTKKIKRNILGWPPSQEKF